MVGTYILLSPYTNHHCIPIHDLASYWAPAKYTRLSTIVFWNEEGVEPIHWKPLDVGTDSFIRSTKQIHFGSDLIVQIMQKGSTRVEIHFIYLSTDMYIYICIYRYRYIHSYIYIYIYIHIYTYIYVYI